MPVPVQELGLNLLLWLVSATRYSGGTTQVEKSSNTVQLLSPSRQLTSFSARDHPCHVLRVDKWHTSREYPPICGFKLPNGDRGAYRRAPKYTPASLQLRRETAAGSHEPTVDPVRDLLEVYTIWTVQALTSSASTLPSLISVLSESYCSL